MFRRDRRELELLDAQLDAAGARLALSRARLHLASRHVLGSRAALLAPLTVGALTGAAVQYREPRRGGRFSVKELLAAVTTVVGFVELVREQALPLLAGLRRGAGDEAEDEDGPVDGGPTGALAARHDGVAGDASEPVEAEGATSPEHASLPSGGPGVELPWPRRIPVPSA